MIYEKQCPICETKFRTTRENKVYCRQTCVNRARSLRLLEKGNFDESLDWFRHDGRWDCPYESAVSCEIRNCDRCGWNPVVAKARLDAYMEKHNEG